MAILYKISDGAVRRRATGFCADVQRHLSSKHRHGPFQVNAANQEGVWQRLYGHDGKGVPKFKVDDHQKSEASVRERVHGKLERGALHVTRSSRLRSIHVPVGRRSR